MARELGPSVFTRTWQQVATHAALDVLSGIDAKVDQSLLTAVRTELKRRGTQDVKVDIVRGVATITGIKREKKER